MSINKDQVKGRVEEARGAAKEVAGKVLRDARMEANGVIQKNLGKAQSKFGDLKQGMKTPSK